MRILVTGARGQLGTELMRVCAEAGDDPVGVDIDTVDITSRSAVHEAVAEIRPDAVIHCAAFTAVDLCESEPDKAMLVNGTAVAYLVEAADATVRRERVRRLAAALEAYAGVGEV